MMAFDGNTGVNSNNNGEAEKDYGLESFHKTTKIDTSDQYNKQKPVYKLFRSINLNNEDIYDMLYVLQKIFGNHSTIMSYAMCCLLITKYPEIENTFSFREIFDLLRYVMYCYDLMDKVSFNPDTSEYKNRPVQSLSEAKTSKKNERKGESSKKRKRETGDHFTDNGDENVCVNKHKIMKLTQREIEQLREHPLRNLGVYKKIKLCLNLGKTLQKFNPGKVRLVNCKTNIEMVSVKRRTHNERHLGAIFNYKIPVLEMVHPKSLSRKCNYFNIKYTESIRESIIIENNDKVVLYSETMFKTTTPLWVVNNQKRIKVQEDEFNDVTINDTNANQKASFTEFSGGNFSVYLLTTNSNVLKLRSQENVFKTRMYIEAFIVMPDLSNPNIFSETTLNNIKSLISEDDKPIEVFNSIFDEKSKVHLNINKDDCLFRLKQIFNQILDMNINEMELLSSNKEDANDTDYDNSDCDDSNNSDNE